MSKRRIIIIGAAGRDFHNFNTRYRDDASIEVVAFTAEQIPGIDDRRYPAELAGPLYPNGIPIFSQDKLPDDVGNRFWWQSFSLKTKPAKSKMGGRTRLRRFSESLRTRSTPQCPKA